MIHNNIAYCSYCNEVLIPEMVDHEWTEEWYADTMRGTCTKCQRMYTWKEWYKLHDLDEFQEITQDTHNEDSESDFNDDADEVGFNPFIGTYDYDC